MATSVNSKGVGKSSSVKVRNMLLQFLQLEKLRWSHCVAILSFIAMVFFILVLMLCFAEINDVLQSVWNQLQRHDLVGELVVGSLVSLISYFLFRPRRVYLVDFACYKPDRKTAITKQELLSFAASTGMYTNESLEFMRKIQERSGVGDDCFMFERRFPMDRSIRAARVEAAATIFYSLDELFAKTGVHPKQVHILVVNSSLFTPTPSLSAMIVNRYKMRTDIKSVNLGGMGCSAGLIAIDLAKDLLRSHRQASYAVVCSQEVLAQSPYFGNDRTKLVTNCLFKLGGAAVLLSNKRWEGWTRAKYELLHTVRTHTGAGDRSYQCVYEEEDEDGHVGVTLKKELMSVAGDALRTNITTLGPLVLPITEQLHFFISLVCRKVLKMNIKPYIPDFKTAFEHFCIHAGGRAVLDEIEKNLKLSAYHMEPSRMTLYRFGNTSSSSLWYELAYTEAMGRVQRGDRVWQIAFGSGFKCNSAAWKALRTIKPPTLNPWNDVLHQFPLKEIPECKLVLPATC